jgi:hypothetical protein
MFPLLEVSCPVQDCKYLQRLRELAQCRIGNIDQSQISVVPTA